MKKKYKKIIEEFEGNFMNNGISGVLADKFQDPKMLLIRDFLLSSLHKVATEAIEAVRLETKQDDINKGGGQYGHPETDLATGYNSAIYDMEQKAKKFLEDNF